MTVVTMKKTEKVEGITRAQAIQARPSQSMRRERHVYAAVLAAEVRRLLDVGRSDQLVLDGRREVGYRPDEASSAVSGAIAGRVRGRDSAKDETRPRSDAATAVDALPASVGRTGRSGRAGALLLKSGSRGGAGVHVRWARVIDIDASTSTRTPAACRAYPNTP